MSDTQVLVAAAKLLLGSLITGIGIFMMTGSLSSAVGLGLIMLGVGQIAISYASNH